MICTSAVQERNAQIWAPDVELEDEEDDEEAEHFSSHLVLSRLTADAAASLVCATLEQLFHSFQPVPRPPLYSKQSDGN